MMKKEEIFMYEFRLFMCKTFAASYFFRIKSPLLFLTSTEPHTVYKFYDFLATFGKNKMKGKSIRKVEIITKPTYISLLRCNNIKREEEMGAKLCFVLHET